jgi:hypothetical protein
MKTDVIIIGAGASGLMCALEAGKRGRSVVVLEHTGRVGSKILISGGGRCNFTNRSVRPENYLSANPHFARSALSRYTPEDFISLVQQHRVDYEEREGGQLFCRHGSEHILEMLKTECDRASVVFRLNCRIQKVSGAASRDGARFTIDTNLGSFDSHSLVIAAGGLSHPGTGATNFGYALARQFGLRLTALRPALTPLRYNLEDAKYFSVLSGVSLDAEVSFGRVRFRGQVLFTHRGLSGPAVLQISSYWDGKSGIDIDVLPNVNVRAEIAKNHGSRMHLATLLGWFLPARFARSWCDRYCGSRPLSHYSTRELDAVAEGLRHWKLQPACTEGFNKAEVTLGGVDTEELSSKTMEVRKVPGLFFTGEVIDVTGQLGGYNLHWAWASGHAAGQVV